MPLIPIAMALAQFAPGIIKLLTGSDKAEAVAEQVVGIAQTVTGTDSPDAALAAIKADPNKVLEFQQAMSAQQVDLEKAYLADVASAREMQIAGHSPVPAILSYLVTVGYFGVLAGMMTKTLVVADSQVALMMLGSLTTAWGSVLAFWFGTTRESARRTDLLAQAVPVKTKS